MKQSIVRLLAVAASFAALSAAPDPKAGARTFSGTIADDVCAAAGHSTMRMGPTDAECAVACINFHGASYVLYDGKNAYTLSDQRTPEQFAGQKVRVVGTLEAKTKTIQVVSISKAK